MHITSGREEGAPISGISDLGCDRVAYQTVLILDQLVVCVSIRMVLPQDSQGFVFPAVGYKPPRAFGYRHDQP